MITHCHAHTYTVRIRTWHGKGVVHVVRLFSSDDLYLKRRACRLDRKPLPQIWKCMHIEMERKRGTEEEGSEQAYKKAKRDDSDSEYADKTKAKCLLLRHLDT